MILRKQLYLATQSNVLFWMKLTRHWANIHIVRVLALSATPGNKLDNVHEVIQNLHISHLELRDENSSDIVPYINKRKVDIILVPLSNELLKFKERYIFIMDPHVKLLIRCNVLKGQTANISKGRIFHLLRDYKTKTDKSGNYGQIMKSLNILLTMYHAYDLLIRHGLRAFFHFYQTHSDKFWMREEIHLRDLLHDIESYLGPFPEVYPSGQISETPTNIVFGHNKFHKLKELLEHHFKKNDNDQKDTRAIVFVEFRDIVNEVYVLLMQSKPLIRPQMFVGQAGQKQKQQLKALEDFRNNRVNVLISTSIGEEGLDVGEVDLIICFDVSQHSPIRLVQRMGRTGRKRDGHIIVLVTDGKEHENLKSTFSKRDSLNNKILNTSNICPSFYMENPRMIPDEFNPDCHKRHIVLPMTPTVKSKRKWKTLNNKNEASVSKQKVSNNKSEASTSKPKENMFTKKDTGQPSMMRFLTNQSGEQNRDNVVTQSRSQGLHNTIRPGEVKLLSDDNAGIEFLTLCAIKKSKEEMSSAAERKMDTTYIPAPKPVTLLFNFVVPDVSAIDLSLIDGLLTQCTMYDGDNPSTQSKNDGRNNVHNVNSSVIDNDNFWGTIRNERNIDNSEVRFEDILDESSDSDGVSCQSQQHLDVNASEAVASNAGDKNKESVANSRTDDSPVFEDMETSMFEDILNESFSLSEDEVENEIAVGRNTESPSFFNDLTENTKRKDATRESTDIASDDKTNIESNQDASMSTEFTRPNQTNGCVNNFVDTLQDCYFDSDDDINQFIRHESSKNNSASNSKANESLFSVTQAIGEIARMKNNNAKTLPRSTSKEKPLVEKNDVEWITVDIKTQASEKESSRIGKLELSNVNRNSIAKSRRNDFNFPDDSDEDFIVTVNNAKKIDEIESSYFCNRNSKNEDSSSLFDASKTFESTKFNSPDTTWKNVKPCGMSTPTSSRRSVLSLNRNKIQHPAKTIDLNSFRAPDKCANNAIDRIIPEPGSSKQTSPVSRKMDEKKIKRRQKCRNDVKNQFIDDEAIVDVSYDLSSDETVNLDDTDDRDLADFVSYTQFSQEDVDMHAHYLRTVRSPVKRPGAFCFKEPRSPDSPVEIYSQPLSLSEAHETYLYDSFCVKEDEPGGTSVHDDSLLERAERELERQKRKRVCSNKNARPAKVKKATNIVIESVSSEDEIEVIRAQVREKDQD
ncbi:Fanconi anemia group M protein isoform X2 [Pseudomyrmex gracilis]|uniref:Fanconi anemia group M protein isoform X2 n=1 Tax=Pseudomyrmex gracilis TaxID=219809 RepID=UPI0009952D9F|nr:Fanconi anemia group M protein isoform X2 [Pseudomyrmex gracilis]